MTIVLKVWNIENESMWKNKQINSFFIYFFKNVINYNYTKSLRHRKRKYVKELNEENKVVRENKNEICCTVLGSNTFMEQ